jgi:predicted kinase
MFTTEEIELLLESLKDWEDNRAEANVKVLAMAAVLAGRGQKGREEEDDPATIIKKMAAESQTETRLRRDRVIMLKAKLLQLRDRAEVDDLAQSL